MAATTTPAGVFGSGRRDAHDVQARARLGRWQLGLVGFFGYMIPGALFFIALSNLIDSIGVETTVAMRLAMMLALPVVAAWRGATIAMTVRHDAVVVRNRWRTVSVPFGEIERIDIEPSLVYGPVQLLTSMYMWSQRYTAFDTAAVTSSDLLVIQRRGRRRRLPAYATLGMTFYGDKVQPLLEALAAHGHAVERGADAGP